MVCYIREWFWSPVLCPRTMKQDQYITLLENRLIPQVKEWFSNDEDFILIQDGAPGHITKSKRVYSPEKHEVLAMAGNSSDLNSIENIQELGKRKIVKETITMQRRLIEKLIQVWYHNPRIKEMIVLYWKYATVNRSCNPSERGPIKYWKRDIFKLQII